MFYGAQESMSYPSPAGSLAGWKLDKAKRDEDNGKHRVSKPLVSECRDSPSPFPTIEKGIHSTKKEGKSVQAACMSQVIMKDRTELHKDSSWRCTEMWEGEKLHIVLNTDVVILLIRSTWVMQRKSWDLMTGLRILSGQLLAWHWAWLYLLSQLGGRLILSQVPDVRLVLPWHDSEYRVSVSSILWPWEDMYLVCQTTEHLYIPLKNN